MSIMSKFYDDVEDNLNKNFNESQYSEELKIINSDSWCKMSPPNHREFLRKEFKKWIMQKTDDVEISESELKNIIMEDLEFLSKMSVEEYTLYRKWCEVQKRTPELGKNIASTAKSLFEWDDVPDYEELEYLKKNIWVPEHNDSYLDLNPELILCDAPSKPISAHKYTAEERSKSAIEWNALRQFTSTMINNSNIGRNLSYIVWDKNTKKYLGLICVSSDFMDLTPRDEYIGWTREQKTTKRMINHTAIGSTIVPTQPLGYKYVGGKLMALLTISNVVENDWNRMYDTEKMPSKLIGMTTTSLYSTFSQYSNLQYWKSRGHSSGSIKFEVSNNVLNKIKTFLKKNYPLKYWEWYLAVEPQGMPLKRDFKQRSLSFIYNKLGIEKKYYETNHSRGIYFCPFFENGNEYLRMEITEDKLVRRKGFEDNSVNSLTKLWKEKYAKKRISSLISGGRKLDNDILFYDDIITMTWEETKQKYLSQVGR